MFFKTLMDAEKNFKQKQITSVQYSRSNGSSASFGNSRSTAGARLWISFSRGVNSSNTITLGPSLTAQSKLLYNSINNLVKKYTGSLRPSASQPYFDCVVFDKDAFGDYISISSTGTFITSGAGFTLVRKSAAGSLSGNQVYNQNNYIPISIQSTSRQSGMLFPWQGVYVHYNQSNRLNGYNTTVVWSPVTYKERALYFPRAGSKQFNFSNNPSFDASSMTRTYITTVGLYGQRSEVGLNANASPLLAVAKLALPVKKNDERQYIFKVSLEY